MVRGSEFSKREPKMRRRASRVSGLVWGKVGFTPVLDPARKYLLALQKPCNREQADPWKIRPDRPLENLEKHVLQE